jgi:flagellar biosynthesis chaperone FliJ
MNEVAENVPKHRAAYEKRMQKLHDEYEKRLQEKEDDYKNVLKQAELAGMQGFFMNLVEDVRQQEREACINVCKDMAKWHENRLNYLQAQVAATCAAAIGARSNV